MKANEITKGGKYVAKVSGVLTTVRVDEIREVTRGRMSVSGWSNGLATVYDVTNLKTGRRTTFKSAAKFRRAVVENPLPEKVQKHLDRVIAGRRPNECLNPELEVMLRQVSPVLNSDVVELIDETEEIDCSCGFNKAVDGKCLRCGRKD